MIIETTNFGEIEIEKTRIINFEDGIPGFKDEKRFIIILNEDEDNPLHWLQSVNTPELSFVITDPFEIYDDYDFDISESLVKKLDLKDESEVAIYTIVVIPEDITKMTTNLLGPIVINTANKSAKQIIIEDDKYTTKHYIIPQESLKESQGGQWYVNTLKKKRWISNNRW